MQKPFPQSISTLPKSTPSTPSLHAFSTCPPQMHRSRPLRHHTMLTTALDHVLNHMRMRDFAAHTPSAVSTGTGIIVSAVGRELVDELLGFFRVFGFWVCAQQAGKVVDVAAGEADERFFFCNRGVSIS